MLALDALIAVENAHTSTSIRTDIVLSPLNQGSVRQRFESGPSNHAAIYQESAVITQEVFVVVLSAQAVLVIGVILFATRRTPDASNQLDSWAVKLQSGMRQLGEDQQRSANNVVQARFDGLGSTMDTHFRGIATQSDQQRQVLESTVNQMQAIRKEHDEKITLLSSEVRQQLVYLREENERKLEAMRQTVEEKLTGTLNSRISESFATVSERLEAVHKGLGEMQSLAAGVGDLKKVMTNVRVRGTWGEYQLSALLEQFLTEDQFERNYCPRPDSREMVEFAIKFPGRSGDGIPVFLPIDSKFPVEDFARLVEASETGDQELVRISRQALLNAIKKSAKDISEKYIHPPTTTDFGVLFLPTESLYAEAVREAGLVEELQRVYRVHLAGPTTLGALLTSFRVGFQSIAIEQRAGEIAKLLGIVKGEFGKFNTVLDKVERNLQTAGKAIASGRVRTRAMERTLREIATLDVDLSAFPIDVVSDSDEIEDEMQSEDEE